ncbi:unnamed protein product [Adineta steineri]|uniref:non-specific serine/threonine protein kinase n=1 Tax=Adineta steineri TaxID=433720 RepID=A0A813NK40_9BILA|nr:unnamed protein product [Adineta steineri]CAF0768911.1 unnamed protein product [Adineta steineri]
MPTRSTYNQPTSSASNHQIINNNNLNQLQTVNSNTDITSYIGKTLTINQHQVIVEDILGQGGFAFVFLVRSTNQQRYALKRMYVNNERDLIVCQREISILKEFSTHTNIVKYIDSSIQRLSPPSQSNLQKKPISDDDDDDTEDDAIYEILLLTEYCSNGALTTRLNEQRNNGVLLNERQILRIFADICNAVSVCHYRRPQPILHRDIKLENILIDSHQSFLLCDFGSAIMLPSSKHNDHQQYQSTQLTTTTIQQLEEEIQRYTTLSYRAPEMIDLYSRLPITLKADIWAMGCLLYKLMYNIMPFGDSILAIQNGTFHIPDDMSQVYSRELNIFVRYILEIDINKRPDIWQVASITYKLLGIDCPIPNRYQSKIPDLSTISMPLTDSEFRHQRAMALANAKSTITNTSDETSNLGTAVNPRERPRGMMAPSGSLINFNQTTQRPTAVVVPPLVPPVLPPAPISTLVPSPSRSSHQRSGSAAQLMFDDDFSQFPNHALSLTNISNVTTPKAAIATPERNVSRARPSPPASLSAASSVTLQQQLFPPPPPSSSNTQLTATPLNHHQHRRSASQTMSPTNNQIPFPQTSSIEPNPSFDRRHSIDSSTKQIQPDVLFIGEASDDDEDDDDEALETNLNKLKVYNHSTENVKSRESLILNEDDRLFAKTYTINSQLKSDDEQSSSSLSDDNEKMNRKNKKKPPSQQTPLRSNHHASTDETDKHLSSPSTTNKNLVKRLIERCSLQQPQQQQPDEPITTSTPYKRKDSFILSNEHPIVMGGHSDNNGNDDDDDDEKRNVNNHDMNNVGFDQLINEDSDDDVPLQTPNTDKTNASSSLFTTSRHKEQQYEHFQDSDDETNHSTPKTSSNPTTKLFNLFTTNSKTNPSNDTKRIINERNNQTNSSFIDNDNPFLHAPFNRTHRSPTQKQISQAPSSSMNVDTISTSNTSSFDPTSIVIGKRLSAFAPYHRQEPNSGNNVIDPTSSSSSAFNFGTSTQKLPHSESFPPGITNNTNPNNQSAISKDVFTNAPFKTKLTTKQQRSMAANKTNAISPSSSHSTSSSNSQLIDFTVPSHSTVESTIKEQTLSSPIRRPVGSAALATNFSTFGGINTKNDAYYFHSERVNEGHSSGEELTSSSSSSTRKRRNKKKSSINTGNDSQQHAYANLSFNDNIVDELL